MAEGDCRTHLPRRSAHPQRRTRRARQISRVDARTQPQQSLLRRRLGPSEDRSQLVRQRVFFFPRMPLTGLQIEIMGFSTVVAPPSSSLFHR